MSKCEKRASGKLLTFVLLPVVVSMFLDLSIVVTIRNFHHRRSISYVVDED